MRHGLAILLLLLVTSPVTAHENAVTMTEDTEHRTITSNGIPDHKTGVFPNKGNPNSISEQQYKYRMPLAPRIKVAIVRVGHNIFGVALNGVPFDPATAEFYNNAPGSGWNYEALSGQIDLGLDKNNAHVQPNGAYHYHGIPTALAKRGEGGHSALIGYAADGFPIYALYGYSDPKDPSSKVKKIRSSYQLRAGERPSGPHGKWDGTFAQDFDYIKGSGDLDECNGRATFTPDYPKGIYAYFLTEEFPYVPRCWHGTPDPSFLKSEESRRAFSGRSIPIPRLDGGEHLGFDGQAPRRAPQEALDACLNKAAGTGCSFQAPIGSINGTCRDLGEMACVPNDHNPPPPR